ncbi:MAG TPA: MFS transporter [Coriobacteriia bacterium]|jgi:MFS family permease
MAVAESPRTIIRTYIATQALFTLSTSIIWGVNTLFLLRAGLSIFQVFLVNAAFSVGDLLFQVPTGVIADTLGRKVSFMLSLATLIVSTLVYVGAYQYRWGVWVFAASSVFLGLGFTFYTGAVDAWMVDALNRVGYTGMRQTVFAWGGMAFSGAMLVGTLSGGLLGQLDLALPFLVRAAMLGLTFLLAAVFMHEVRAERPPITPNAFAERSREVLVTGLSYCLHNPVVRPLLFASAVQGLFLMFGFYSWQPYFLGVLGTDAIWLTGVVAALFALAGITGNALVGVATRKGTAPAAPLLARLALGQAVIVALIGIFGVLLPRSDRGFAPFAILVVLYVAYGVLFGIFRPVRMAFINPHLMPEQRATALSLDTLFADAGGTAGQPGLGYLSQVTSIPLAWLLSGAVMAIAYPLYRRAARADAAEGPPTAVARGDGVPSVTPRR